MPPEIEIPRLPKSDHNTGDISFVVYQSPESITNELATQFWVTTVLSLDIALQDETNPDTNAFLIRYGVSMHRQFEKSRHDLNESVVAYLQTHPAALYLNFAYGSIPDMIDVWNHPGTTESARDRMHSVVVGGSVGAAVSRTEVKSNVPKRNSTLQPVVFHDDIGDSMVAVAALLEYIVCEGDPDRIRKSDLSSRLSGTFGKDYEQYRDAYRNVIKALHKNQVVLAVTAYKNLPFLEELLAYASGCQAQFEDDDWAQQQLELLKPVIERNPDHWLKGLGSDSNIDAELILPFLDADILDHPKTKFLIDHFRSSRIRVGSTIDTFVALQKRGNNYAYDELVRWVAKNINTKLRRLIDPSV